jgi:hypothetical protein
MHDASHRSIAFFAEFALYELWAEWIGVSFWGKTNFIWDNDNYLWLIVLIGGTETCVLPK